MACNEMVSEGGARRRLGFDGVDGEAVRYELDECCPVAGHQHLIGSQPQGQLRFLHHMHHVPVRHNNVFYMFFVHVFSLHLNPHFSYSLSHSSETS